MRSSSFRLPKTIYFMSYDLHFSVDFESNDPSKTSYRSQIMARSINDRWDKNHSQYQESRVFEDEHELVRVLRDLISRLSRLDKQDKQYPIVVLARPRTDQRSMEDLIEQAIINAQKDIKSHQIKSCLLLCPLRTDEGRPGVVIHILGPDKKDVQILYIDPLGVENQGFFASMRSKGFTQLQAVTTRQQGVKTDSVDRSIRDQSNSGLIQMMSLWKCAVHFALGDGLIDPVFPEPMPGLATANLFIRCAGNTTAYRDAQSSQDVTGNEYDLAVLGKNPLDFHEISIADSSIVDLFLQEIGWNDEDRKKRILKKVQKYSDDFKSLNREAHSFEILKNKKVKKACLFQQKLFLIMLRFFFAKSEVDKKKAIKNLDQLLSKKDISVEFDKKIIMAVLQLTGYVPRRGLEKILPAGISFKGNHAFSIFEFHCRNGGQAQALMATINQKLKQLLQQKGISTDQTNSILDYYHTYAFKVTVDKQTVQLTVLNHVLLSHPSFIDYIYETQKTYHPPSVIDVSLFKSYPKSYKKLTENPQDTLALKGARLFSDYAEKGLCYFHWRHHQKFARLISEELDRKFSMTPDQLNTFIDQKLAKLKKDGVKVNPKGSFMARMSYFKKLIQDEKNQNDLSLSTPFTATR